MRAAVEDARRELQGVLEGRRRTAAALRSWEGGHADAHREATTRLLARGTQLDARLVRLGDAVDRALVELAVRAHEVARERAPTARSAHGASA